MNIPEFLYNSNQKDQSIDAYINAYDSVCNMINESLELDYPIPGFSRKELISALKMSLYLGIIFRVAKIIEKHCGETCEIKVKNK